MPIYCSQAFGPEGEEQEPLASASKSKRKAWGDKAVSIPVNTITNIFMFIDHYFTYNHFSYVFDYPKQFFFYRVFSFCTPVSPVKVISQHCNLCLCVFWEGGAHACALLPLVPRTTERSINLIFPKYTTNFSINFYSLPELSSTFVLRHK